MSPQDSQMLNDFLGQLIQARGVLKDPEADALIQRAVEKQPDAAYLLVQRALLLEQALNNAKQQVASLESQVDVLRSSRNDGRNDGRGDGRFLDPNAWGNSAASRAGQGQSYQRDAQPQYQQPQAQYQPGYAPYHQAPPLQSGFLRGGFGGGGLGGTLGTIAATAAGVAAGGFLFHGLENMFGHHGNGGNHLLNGDDPSNNLFSDQSNDQSHSALADQAGLGDVGQSLDGGAFAEGPADSLFDSGADTDVSETNGGFFDGDGSDEGLFS